MSWQRYRVELVDREPIDVQTNARDWAGVVIDPNAPKAMDLNFRVVHSALLRAGVDVPKSYDAFLDLLDAMPTELDGDAEVGALDPTGATP